jgi:hypothetical protein
MWQQDWQVLLMGKANQKYPKLVACAILQKKE